MSDPAADTSIEIVCAKAGKTFTVEPGTSILDALSRAGVRVRRSCRRGLCGTCRVGVLEGTPDHRDGVLSAADRRSGKVMQVCVSWATTERLVLDL